MTWVKKILATSMAASLVFGTLALAPASEVGTSLGALSVARADSSSYQLLIDEMTKLHDSILPSDRADVQAARDNLRGLADTSLILPITSKIPSSDPDLDAARLLAFVSAFGSFYYGDLTTLDDIRTDPAFRATLDKLIKLGGYSGGLNDVTFDDVYAFLNAIKTQAEAEFQSKSAAQLAILAFDQSASKAVLKAGIDQVLAKTTDYKFSKVLDQIGITSQDIMDTKDLIAPQIDHDGKARAAMTIALLRSEAVFSTTESSNGSTQTLHVSLFGHMIPEGVLTWHQVSGDSNVSISGDAISLTSGTSADAVVEAIAPVLVKQLVLHEVTLRKASSGGGGGGGGTPGTTPPEENPAQPVDPGKVVGDAKKTVDDLKDQLKGAQGADKDKLLKQVQDQVKSAIDKITKIDLHAQITVTGGKAVPKLDVQGLITQIKDIKQQISTLQEAVADLGVKPAKIEFKLDLGSVEAKETQVPLSNELLKAAAEQGVDSIAVQVNGLEIAVDPTTFQTDVDLNVAVKDKAEATSVTDNKVASDVYEFHFASGGQPLENLDKPVEVRIPIENANQYDTELLTLAKISDGKLIYYGGVYNPDTGTLNASRRSFSTYTVVENKVTFQDTAKVDAWAGRPIQVAAAKGVIVGEQAGIFAPNDNVTRAEFAKMLVGTFGLLDIHATESFNDVKVGDWFTPYVASAVKAGIVSGRTDLLFDPNASISREEMAVMAARALKAAGLAQDVADPDAALQAFVDASAISPQLKAGVALAAQAGLVTGQPGNVFAPKGTATRAEAAVVVYNLIKKQE